MFKMIKTNVFMDQKIKKFLYHTVVSKGTTCFTRKNVSMKQTKGRISENFFKPTNDDETLIKNHK